MKINLLDSLPSGSILRIHTEESGDEGVDPNDLHTFAVIFDPASDPPTVLWLSEEDILQITRDLNIFLDKPSDFVHSTSVDEDEPLT